MRPTTQEIFRHLNDARRLAIRWAIVGIVVLAFGPSPARLASADGPVEKSPNAKSVKIHYLVERRNECT